ncbi:hypothetical protein, partial [uncultured Marinobacter sp.]|uniref:hypothetical protein n=1 Tax=uncultured Marinobacter sp. TaxID=187379 RepID=UPI0030C7BD93
PGGRLHVEWVATFSGLRNVVWKPFSFGMEKRKLSLAWRSTGGTCPVRKGVERCWINAIQSHSTPGNEFNFSYCDFTLRVLSIAFSSYSRLGAQRLKIDQVRIGSLLR